jgi:excisionase family DNA binding protein
MIENDRETPIVLTVEEAGRVLRIGRSAAYQAARSGELPTIRIGRCLRVPLHRLEEMLGRNDDLRRATRTGPA